MLSLENEKTCPVCECTFLGDGDRCSECTRRDLKPGVKNDTKDVVYSEEQKFEKWKEKIKSLVREVLDEIKLEKAEKKYKEKPCKKCGRSFIPKVPSQLYCDICGTRGKDA